MSASLVAARYLFTPTMVCLPVDAALRRAAASSIMRLGMPASMALAMPPIFSTSSMCRARGGEIVGQALDIEAAAPRIDDAGRAAFLLQEHELGVAGDARREIGRQRERLVERIGVQRLGVALRRRHRLDAVRTTLLNTSCAARLQPSSGNGCAARAIAGPSARTRAS